jgi:uncharacterized protein (DUF1330 family)
MATYMLFIREGEIVDQEAMNAYGNRNRSGPPNPDVKPLVVYGAMEAFEGEAPDGIVMLEFPDAAAAKAWYFSPDYQEAAKLRRKGAPSYRAIMVEGL